jgi:hypothetical protein
LAVVVLIRAGRKILRMLGCQNEFNAELNAGRMRLYIKDVALLKKNRLEARNLLISVHHGKFQSIGVWFAGLFRVTGFPQGSIR